MERDGTKMVWTVTRKMAIKREGQRTAAEENDKNGCYCISVEMRWR